MRFASRLGETSHELNYMALIENGGLTLHPNYTSLDSSSLSPSPIALFQKQTQTAPDGRKFCRPGFNVFPYSLY